MTTAPLPAGLVVVRGAGHGTVAGLIAALLLFPIAVALDGGSPSSIGLGFALGLIVAPFGVIYGSIAGTVVGAAVAPFRHAARARAIARLIAAIVGVVVVAAISWVWFRPAVRFERGHLEDLLVYYGVPCLEAVAAGLAFGDRLVRPLVLSD